ncbi:hypothetical protein AIQ71_21160 [Salmonella enterica]|uniref:Uncharacterized protein n=1 Tax=Salmonella enterica TaxID=28901 RepID=A0A742RKU8_SALER|nr:hypothetical protein [Salmonella enterica]EAX2442581.1 hypothetical protein [Salmonella enterica]EAX2451228.1 hypothetical protein [Salmonella enterica]EAY7418537.1 hypothetical protein [Salmonella enterica]EAY7862615.1 hypothetical protein [Salmonella enterica]
MRLTARRQFAGVQKAQDTARKKGGVTGTVAASLPLTLRQPGMETRCPEGAGQKTENGRIRMDYMRLSGKPRQQGG